MTTHGTLAPVTAAIEPRPPRARWRQSSLVWALTATHFVSRAGGVARSFLVLYLTQERQLSPTTAGAVVAAVGIGDTGSQLLGGWLGDRIGRRHTMLVGFLGTAVALVALGSAETMPAICAASVGVGLTAELFRPAGSAAVADLPAQERLRAFGLLFWAANLGFTISTVAAGVLVQQGYGILFWINAAASVLAALIVWRHVPETRPPTPKATRRALLPVLLRDPVMLAMAAIHVVYFATFLQTFSTLPLVMAGDGHGPGTYGALLALNGIVIVVAQPIAVRLLDGRDRASVLAVSMLLVGVGGGLGAVVHSGASHAGSILVWTLGEIGIAVMFGATFANLAPADLRGRYMGVASTTWSLGAVLGPLAGTALLDHAGRTALWAACSATGLALFAAQQAVAPALRRRTLRPGRATSDLPMRQGRPRSVAKSPGKSRADATGCQPAAGGGDDTTNTNKRSTTRGIDGLGDVSFDAVRWTLWSQSHSQALVRGSPAPGSSNFRERTTASIGPTGTPLSTLSTNTPVRRDEARLEACRTAPPLAGDRNIETKETHQ